MGRRACRDVLLLPLLLRRCSAAAAAEPRRKKPRPQTKHSQTLSTPPPPAPPRPTLSRFTHTHTHHSCPPPAAPPLQHSGESYSLTIGRDLEITAADRETALDFSFLADVALIGDGRRVLLQTMTVENTRRGAGLGVDFFAGAENSTLALVDVVRWRYVCTSPADAVKAHSSYPRAPRAAPGPQRVTLLPKVCVRRECFEGGNVHYVDFAMAVAPAMSESTAYLPGYTLVLANTTRVCSSLVPDACLLKATRDECLVRYTDEYIASLRGGGAAAAAAAQSRARAAAALGASLGGAALLAAAAAGLLVHTRRRRRRRREDEEIAAKALLRFGPLEGDMVLSNQQRGWRVTHRARASHLAAAAAAAGHGHGSGGAGSGGGAGGGAGGLTDGVLSERIELGVLLGAGSFGRVYKGRWQGRDVAVKVMQHDARTASRIANEVELMMMMEHPNILKAHDVITWTHTSESADATAAAQPPASGARKSSTGGGSRSGALNATVSGPTLLSSGGGGGGGGLLGPASDGLAIPGRVSSGGGTAPATGAGGGAVKRTSLDGALRSSGGVLPLLKPNQQLRASQQQQQQPSSNWNTSSGGGAASPHPTSAAGGAGGSGSSDGARAPDGSGATQQSSGNASANPNGGANGASGNGDAGLAPSPSPGSFSRGGAGGGGGVGRAALSFVPVRSLGGGAVAPLLIQEHPSTSPDSTPGVVAAASSGALACVPHSAPLPGVPEMAEAPAAPADGGAATAAGLPTLGSDSDTDGHSRGPEAEAQTWLVVEYCDAGTLADAVRGGRLGPRGQPDMARALARLRDVAAGMAYLHSRNTLHGDLKAANVLLATCPGAPFGLVAKVADFGLSRTLKVGQTHRSTRTVGTVTHMPPELLRLGKLSPAGDVYAFGIILWCACGWAGGEEGGGWRGKRSDGWSLGCRQAQNSDLLSHTHKNTCTNHTHLPHTNHAHWSHTNHTLAARQTGRSSPAAPRSSACTTARCSSASCCATSARPCPPRCPTRTRC